MTNRAQHIIVLCEYYEGPPKMRHKLGGLALGAAGLGAAALAGHSLATGQNPLTTLGNMEHSVADWWQHLPTTPPTGAMKQTQQSLVNKPVPTWGRYAPTRT